MSTCTGTTKDGKPCRSAAVADSDPPRCRRHMHTGASPKSEQSVRKQAFLEAYRLLGVIGPCCQQAGIARRTYYVWLDSDPEFAAAVVEAKDDSVDSMERELMRRAVTGWTEPVFYKGRLVLDDSGKPVGVRKFSDTLLIFGLKAARPDKYRERTSIEHSGSVSTGIPDSKTMAAKADELAARRERKAS